MSKLKVASARRQLGTALSLYLQDLDPVSVHCLAGGGCELIEYYAKKAGAQPFASHILKTFPDMKISEVRRLQRQYWSAFKHATHQHSGEERDDHALLKRFTDSQNDHVLFIGWYDYAAAECNAYRGTGTSNLVLSTLSGEASRGAFTGLAGLYVSQPA